MAYTVLARRYRSSNFDEVIGQEHIAQTLKKAIESDRLAHAYLFCGTRGTGKTSTARILAKCLNCESSDKPTAHPCGKCNSCQAIARGDDIDVIEIDAASNTGVDNVRDLISNAQFRPARSRFKVYIIDEVHMLSKSAFNALLKTLEEPPEHVKFILATTEPEKVLQTILSRCQRYDFRNIPTREIAEHLADICKKEKIKADEDALLLVAKSGAGSMRDSLSLLDRLLSIGEKELNVGMIEDLLGLPKSQLIFDLAEAIATGDVKATLTRADAMINSGLSNDALLVSLIDHLRNLMILRVCGIESKLIEVPGLSPKDLVAQGDKFDPAALVQDIAILEELRRQLRTSQAGRALLDASLARLTLADQFASIGDLAQGAADLPADGDASKKKDDVTPAPEVARAAIVESFTQSLAPSRRDEQVASPREGASEVAAPSVTASVVQDSASDESASSEEDDDVLPAVGKVWEEGPKRSLGDIFKRANTATASKPSIQNITPVAPTEFSAKWSQLLGRVTQDSPPMSAWLSGSQLVEVNGDRALVRLTNPSGPKYFETNGRKEKLNALASEILGKTIGVSFEVVAAPPAEIKAPVQAAPRPPVQSRNSNNAAPAQVEIPSTPTIPLTPELKEELMKDPLLKAVVETLGAQIVRVENSDV